MTEAAPRANFPARFRRRLTVIFVVVASSASGALAASSYTAVTAQRERSFVDRATFQAATTAALLRSDVEPDDIGERLAAFGETLTADVVALAGDSSFASSPRLDRALLPASLVNDRPLDGDAAEISVGGTNYRIIGMTAERSGTDLYFFFSREELEESLRELATILAVGWIAVTAISAGVGAFVARRTLRPVRTAADAARAIAEGLLDTRLPVSGSDEFSTLARTFNEMAQALQAKLDELSIAHQRERRFTGDVAHELMTPLGALVAEASVLETHLDGMEPTARRMAELLVSDIRRLRSLVEELLELARLDAERAVGDYEEVSIGALITPIAATLSTDGIRLSGDVDTVVHVNRGCLERIVSNLIRNAVVHGRPPIDIEVAAGRSMVLVSVRDHGPGLAPDDVPHVFDRFYKADSSRSGGGTGLGLAIASEYARLIGADLSVANHPQGGAVFTLALNPPAVQRQRRRPRPDVRDLAR